MNTTYSQIEILNISEQLNVEIETDTFVKYRSDIIAVNPFALNVCMLEHKNDSCIVGIKANVPVIMSCANTLEEVKTSLQFDSIVTIVNHSVDHLTELTYEVSKNLVNFNEIAFDQFVLELPIRVVKSDFTTQTGKGWKIVSDINEANENSPFSKLRELTEDND